MRDAATTVSAGIERALRDNGYASADVRCSSKSGEITIHLDRPDADALAHHVTEHPR